MRETRGLPGKSILPRGNCRLPVPGRHVDPYEKGKEIHVAIYSQY